MLAILLVAHNRQKKTVTWRGMTYLLPLPSVVSITAPLVPAGGAVEHRGTLALVVATHPPTREERGDREEKGERDGTVVSRWSCFGIRHGSPTVLSEQKGNTNLKHETTHAPDAACRAAVAA